MLKNFFKVNPFACIVIPLILGIVFSKYVLFYDSNVLQYVLVTTLLAVVIFHFVFKYSGRWLFGSFGSLFLLVFGFYIHKNQNSENLLPSEKLISEQYMLVQITDFPEEKAKSYKVPLVVEGIKHDTALYKVKIGVIAYFAKDIRLDSLMPGNKLVVKSKLKEHNEKLNEFDFDYGEYLVNKNIHYTAYVKSDNWYVVSTKVGGVKNRALIVRDRILSIYKQAGLSGNEFAVFSALTLGYKNDLDREVRETFAGAGAMHILAVSGMHVGIVYLILMQIFSLFGILKNRYSIQLVLIIAGIWFYAFLTGLSPSVTRAATMATFILGGKLIGKRVDIFNSIAASAFVLLLYNANYLFDVGFQLSYMALIGIVVFYKRIYGLVYFKYKIPDMFWQLTVVGIAAQIGTFPLSIFYFHQFPTYFWITGALVVMLAYIMMFGAVILLLSSLYDRALDIVGMIVHYVTLSLEYLVVLVNSLPFSVVKFYYLSSWQIVLIYISIISLVVGVFYKKTKSIIVCLILVLVIMFDNMLTYSKNLPAENVTVCYTFNDSAIRVSKNGYCMWLVNDMANSDIYDMIENANAYYHIPEWKSTIMFVDDYIEKGNSE